MIIMNSKKVLSLIDYQESCKENHVLSFQSIKLPAYSFDIIPTPTRKLK